MRYDSVMWTVVTNRLDRNFCCGVMCHILHISLHQNSAQKDCLYLLPVYLIHSLIVSFASEEFENEWMNVQVLKHQQHEWHRLTVKHITVKHNTPCVHCPGIAVIVRQLLGVPTTLVASEWLFLKAGDIITKKRNRLELS